MSTMGARNVEQVVAATQLLRSCVAGMSQRPRKGGHGKAVSSKSVEETEGAPAEPIKAPGPTLFDAPLASVDEVRADTIAVVGMPTDWTHSSRIGAREGPAALRPALLILH